MKLTLCAALLALAPCVYGDELPVRIDGTAHTLDVDYGALHLLMRRPDVTRIQRDPTGIVGAHAADGSLWSVGADGSIYVDAMPLGTNKVSELALVGRSVYAKGATDAKWWRWSGTSWVAVPNVNTSILVPTARATAAIESPKVASK